MNHEEITKHLRLAEIAGFKLKLEDDPVRGRSGLYLTGYPERWEPFTDLGQAYKVLSRFCERYDEANLLVTWTLDREKTPDGFPKFIFHVEVLSKISGTLWYNSMKYSSSEKVAIAIPSVTGKNMQAVRSATWLYPIWTNRAMSKSLRSSSA